MGKAQRCNDRENFEAKRVSFTVLQNQQISRVVPRQRIRCPIGLDHTGQDGSNTRAHPQASIKPYPKPVPGSLLPTSPSGRPANPATGGVAKTIARDGRGSILPKSH
jgi:hypothetical protein